jgi:hypothetical protein
MIVIKTQFIIQTLKLKSVVMSNREQNKQLLHKNDNYLFIFN